MINLVALLAAALVGFAGKSLLSGLYSVLSDYIKRKTSDEVRIKLTHQRGMGQIVKSYEFKNPARLITRKKTVNINLLKEELEKYSMLIDSLAEYKDVK